MGNAVGARGTTLAKKVDAVETVISELTSIGGPSMSADTIEVTNHDSPDGYREFLGGPRDAGEVSIEGNWINDAGQAALVTDFHAGSTNQYVITFPNADKWTFSAIVTGLEFDAPMDGKLGFSGSLKITGKPVLTKGA